MTRSGVVLSKQCHGPPSVHGELYSGFQDINKRSDVTVRRGNYSVVEKEPCVTAVRRFRS